MTTDKTQVVTPKERPPKPSTDVETSVSPSKPPTGEEPQRLPISSTDDVVKSESSRYRRSGPTEGPVAKVRPNRQVVSPSSG